MNLSDSIVQTTFIGHPNAEQRSEGGLRIQGYFKKSLPDKPLITVITVVLNGEKHLEDTILSVLNQTYDNVEYIIIDGGSTDGTPGIIRQYEGQLDYWLSEKDEGIYDAMNKGLDKASGDFIVNINIGDLLLDVPVNELLHAIQLNSDVASFNVKLNEITVFKPRRGFISKLDNCLHHQGTFYNRKLTERYDVTYKVFADFDLNQRLIKKQCNISLYNKVVSYHSENGLSHNRDHFEEVWQIIKINQGIFYVFIAFVYFKIMGLWNRIKILATLF